jgi:hypothetical protein
VLKLLTVGVNGFAQVAKHVWRTVLKYELEQCILVTGIDLTISGSTNTLYGLKAELLIIKADSVYSHHRVFCRVNTKRRCWLYTAEFGEKCLAISLECMSRVEKQLGKFSDSSVVNCRNCNKCRSAFMEEIKSPSGYGGDRFFTYERRVFYLSCHPDSAKRKLHARRRFEVTR